MTTEKPTDIAAARRENAALRAQLDAVERLIPAWRQEAADIRKRDPYRQHDRLEGRHQQLTGCVDELRSALAPKAPTTKEENLMLTTSIKLATAMDLLGRASSYFADNEAAPDVRWHREFFLLSGDHMILTEDGWTHGADKGEYEPGDILDEVNVPKAPTTTPTEESHE